MGPALARPRTELKVCPCGCPQALPDGMPKHQEMAEALLREV